MIGRKVGQMVCLQGSRRHDSTLNGGGDCPGPGGPQIAAMYGGGDQHGPGGPQIAAMYGGGDCPGSGTPRAINGFHSKDSKKISPA
jgi:hypothetical protein